jgi:CRISPR-associated endonuclease/helicase Cas3
MMPFDTVSKQFCLIDQNTETIFVEEEESKDLIAELRRGEYSMSLYRKLGQFAVNVYSQQIAKLRSMGMLEMIEEGTYILRDSHAYSHETGLNVNVTSGYGIIL